MQRTFDNLLARISSYSYENDSIATTEIKYGDNDRLALKVHKYQVQIV